MNFQKISKTRTSPDINLTPLVDVVLLLVLFFMATSSFSVIPGLKLILPGVDSESRVRVPPAERLEISVTAEGDIYFEDQLTTMQNLPHHLIRTGAAGDEVVIVVNADQSVAYGRIIKIMDTLRQEGFNRVVFSARQENPEDEAAR